MGLPRSGLPDAQRCPAPMRDGLRERERDENFPVALRVLPKAVRMDLHAVYAVARTIDDLGDLAPGDFFF